MLENRNLKLDLLALGLLAAVVFLAAALLSYDPADPPSKLVSPQNIQATNVCGYWGAAVSRILLELLGWGAYYLVVSLALLDAVLLTRHTVTRPWLRAVGWWLSMLGVTSFAALAAGGLSPGPVIGPGGYLGAISRVILLAQFASLGAFIIAISMIAGGLLLCTDYLLVRLLAWILANPTRSLGRGMLQVGAAYAQKLNRRRSDLDDYEAEPSGGGLAVRPPGQKNRAQSTSDLVESDDTEVETPSSGGRKAFGSRVGISRPKSGTRQMTFDEVQHASDLGANTSDYHLPSLDLLVPGEKLNFEDQEKDVRQKAKILEKTFADFGFNVRVVEIQTGPVIAQFEVELEAGLRLSRITGLADDLAIALRVPSVRIVAPLPGKNTVGIEVPNQQRQIVHLREVIEEANGKSQRMRIPLYLGKDVAGHPLVVDLTTLPHLLIAGRTGTGKSVCLNSIIVSILMTRRPDEVRMLMVDPKMVELSPYKFLPHLMHPVVTDMRKAEAILGWAVEKMEERYHLLARAGVRHISVYNQLGEDELMERIQPEDDEERKQIPTHMPYIVLVADELADLMMTAAKEVEGHIIRLAQKSRAVGIHLVLATQKPTVDVITGLIKSNLPARIAFQVASRTDSRVVLDEMGADKLLGNGDMLFLWPGTSTLIRGQGTYLSDDEISRVIGAVATSEPQYVKELVQLKAKAPEGNAKLQTNRDELYEAAVDIVVREGRGSVSLLQRALGIGYGRAARLIDFMAEDGIVGPYNGSQAREILLTLEQWEQRNSAVRSQPTADTPQTRRSPQLPQSGSDDYDDQLEEEDDELEDSEDLSTTDEYEESSDGDFDSEDIDDEQYTAPADDEAEPPPSEAQQPFGKRSDRIKARWKAESA